MINLPPTQSIKLHYQPILVYMSVITVSYLCKDQYSVTASHPDHLLSESVDALLPSVEISQRKETIR